MKKIVLNCLRIIIAALFVFSGITKCIDPIGGAIKIEDYFMAWGIDAPESLPLILSFAQNALEFLVGFLLLLKVHVRFSSFVVMCFMIFYTPLTLYIAIANPVSDCGCFGDAVKLSNWGTFIKNLIFLPIAIVVFHNRKLFVSSLRPIKKCVVLCIGLLISILISFGGVTDEPLVDFRPYSVGTHIRSAMEIPADAPLPEYRTTFLLQKDGQISEFDENNYPYDDSTWVFVDSRTEQISEGYVPAIKDFTLLSQEGNMMTDVILDRCEPTYLAIVPSVEKLPIETIEKLGRVAMVLYGSDVPFYVCTASSGSALRQMEDIAQVGFEFLSADETMLKTITRCNGGLIAIEHGTIVAKYHIDHVPALKQLPHPTATYLTNKEAENDRLLFITAILVTGILTSLLYIKHRRK